MTCPHEHHEMDSACADGICPLCLSAKFLAIVRLLRIIARGVEIGQSGRARDLNRGDMQRLARQYCDDNKLTYAVKDLRVEERVGFLKVGKEA